MSSPELIIGPYRIVEQLGRGGMGIVYRAVHQETGKQVALKTVLLPKSELLQSLRREIVALAALNHPGIVRIVAHGMHQNMTWYAMEYLEGLTLRRYHSQSRRNSAVAADTETSLGRICSPTKATIESRPTEAGETSDLGNYQGPLDLATDIIPVHGLKDSWFGEPDQKNNGIGPSRPILSLLPHEILDMLTMVRRLCQPLAYIHGRGIVHRDLKPENIVITPEGQPIIVDFGLVTRFSDHQAREALGVEERTAGSVHYMAPEQIRGELVDARADLYALGCIMYELLTGSAPFRGESGVEILQAHLYAVPRPPSESVPGLPVELDRLILKLLAKDPQERLGFASDVAAILAHLGAKNGLSSLGPTPRSYFYRPGFSGREMHLTLIREHLDRVKAGQASILLLGGESGVGKTRLAIEAGREAVKLGMRVLTGECTEHSGQPLEGLRKPLQVIADYCREYGLNETERILGPRGPIVAPYEPALVNLPGQSAYAQPTHLPYAAFRLRLYNALVQTLEAMTQDKPMVLMLDDLQWADDLLIDFLHFLGADPDRDHFPLFVLATYRSEETNSDIENLLHLPHIRALQLDRLSSEAVRNILQHMLALKEPPSAFTHFLAQQSEGNPFFVIEYIRTAVEAGLIVRASAGTWHIPTELFDPTHPSAPDLLLVTIPQSIQELLEKRLQGLKPGSLFLVQIGAVIGREINLALLEKMSAMSEVTFLQSLDELIRREIVDQNSPLTVSFSHDKIREVTYNNLGLDQLRRFHQQAAENLEQLFQTDLNDYLAALGHHWEQAGLIEKARQYYLKAAERSKNCFAADAERLYRDYLRLSPGITPQTVAARNQMAINVLSLRGFMQQARSELIKSYHDALVLNDPSTTISSLLYLSDVNRTIGDLTEAENNCIEALEHANQAQLSHKEVDILEGLARIKTDQGKLVEAHELIQKAFDLLPADAGPDKRASICNQFGNILRLEGQLIAAQIKVKEALALDRLSGNTRWEAISLTNLAAITAELGQLDEAISLGREALHKHQTIGDRRGEAVMYNDLGAFLVLKGLYDQARTLLESALPIHRQIGDRRTEAICLLNLVEIYQHDGQFSKAQDTAQIALHIRFELGDRYGQANCLSQLAQINFRLGHVQEALEQIQKARDIQATTGNHHKYIDTLVFNAKLERLLEANWSRARELLDESEHLSQQYDYQFGLIATLCERGHVNLATNRTARAELEHIQNLISTTGTTPPLALSEAIEQLSHDLDAFERGQNHALFRGSARANLPQGIITT
ncbi:protein kinase [bacterium]|nr:protein kinase [bacterium]